MTKRNDIYSILLNRADLLLHWERKTLVTANLVGRTSENQDFTNSVKYS